MLPDESWDEEEREKKHFSAIDSAGELFYAEPEDREYWNTKYKDNFYRETMAVNGKKITSYLEASDGLPIKDEQLRDRAFMEAHGWNFDGCWYMGADGPHLRKGVCQNRVSCAAFENEP